MIGLALWVWIDKRMQKTPESAPVPVQAVEPRQVPADSGASEQITHLQEMLRRAERQLGDQREEIEALERQLAEAQAEATRNRQGLEKAVDELNRINEELNQLEASAMVQQSWSPPAAPSPQVGPLGAPHVTILLRVAPWK